MKSKMSYVRVLLCIAITAGLYTAESFARWICKAPIFTTTHK